jgi:hypothetical protein
LTIMLMPYFFILYGSQKRLRDFSKSVLEDPAC